MTVTHIGQELYTIVSRSLSPARRNQVVEDLATLAEVLENLDTLGVGQVCDRKIDENGFRVFLSRCGLADGEPFENTVYLEEYDKEQGRWIDVGYFDGDVLFRDLGDFALRSFGTRT